MENRLRLLYALQLVDLQLDELQDMKGDLPGIVANLQERLNEKQAQKKTFETTVKDSLVKRDTADNDILSLKEKIEKYKAQQFQVKTNKQYDTLAREIDMAQESITRLTKDLEVLEGRATVAKDDVTKVDPEITEIQTELEERQKELDAVNKEHEDEELRLKHQREKIAARIKKDDITMYERIRKAKDGKAVVPVKRNACGGCYNRVPPQRVLELRKNDMMMTCERCGRVIVSDEIAETKLEL